MNILSTRCFFLLIFIFVATIVSSAPARAPPRQPASPPTRAPPSPPAIPPSPPPSPPAHAPPGGEVEDETEFSYETKGKKGPAKWGTLKEEWKMCGIGKMQSPIDVTDKKVVVTTKLGSLRSQYLPSNTTIKNRGHDIMLKFNGGNGGKGIIVGGVRYQFQQLHWHSPSEHTINGKSRRKYYT